MNNCVRTIHTFLYGQEAMRMLNSVIKYVKRYGSTHDSRAIKFIVAERGTDNEILLNVYDEGGYTYNLDRTILAGNKSLNDVSIRQWLANLIKGMTKISLGYRRYDIRKAAIAKCDGWKRDNDAVIVFGTGEVETFTADQAYALYEALKGRTLPKTKYDSTIMSQIIGEPFDPVRTELEQFRREEIKRITAECDAKNAEVKKWFNDEYYRLENQRSAKRKEINDAMNAEIAKINAEIDAALADANKPAENVVPVEQDLDKALAQSEAA